MIWLRRRSSLASASCILHDLWVCLAGQHVPQGHLQSGERTELLLLPGSARPVECANPVEDILGFGALGWGHAIQCFTDVGAGVSDVGVDEGAEALKVS
jgi:hypothetical protein